MLAAIGPWILGIFEALQIPVWIGFFVFAIKRISSLGAIGAVWSVILFLCIDIITPPYLLGTESVFAGLIAGIFALFGFGFAAVFSTALIFIYGFALIFVIGSFVSVLFF